MHQYTALLNALTAPDKAAIDALTMRAGHLRATHAAEVVDLTERQLASAPPGYKLAVLYLIDSILKNVGGEYIWLFSGNIADLFVGTFWRVDTDVKWRMRRLWDTWSASPAPVHPDRVTLIGVRLRFKQDASVQTESALALAQTRNAFIQERDALEDEVDALYGKQPMQCTNCGRRFGDVQELADHKDWHFQRGEHRVRHRAWYPDEEGWLADRDREAVPIVPDVVARPEGRVMDTRPMDISCATRQLADGTTVPEACYLCDEKIECFFHHGLEAWHWRGAVRFNGRACHYKCYSGLVAGNEEGELEMARIEDVSAEEMGEMNVAMGEMNATMLEMEGLLIEPKRKRRRRR